MKLKILRDKRAYSLTFWTVFFGFILVPIIALGIELGRYYYARAKLPRQQTQRRWLPRQRSTSAYSRKVET